MFFQRIMTEYLRDQTLLHAHLTREVAGLAVEEPAQAGARAWYAALDDANKAHAEALVQHDRELVLQHIINQLRDSNLARAVSMSCNSDRMRQAIRKKANEGVTFHALADFKYDQSKLMN